MPTSSIEKTSGHGTRSDRPEIRKIEVGILGATGIVGQQMVARLERHKWFRATWLAASVRSAGQRFGDLPWRLASPMPANAASLTVETIKPGSGPQLIFSALDSSVAGEVEAEFAAAGHVVVSNSRNHRMDPLVPLLIPEVNPDHLDLLPLQKQKKGWKGAIVTNPNCSTVFLVMALAALRPFDPKRVLVTTLQALSGAGYPGVASLDASANVIPYIEGEEEKIEAESRKILGRFENGVIEPFAAEVSATATRVPVIDGHTEMVSVELDKQASRDEILHAFRSFSGEPQESSLPSAPLHPIAYHDLPNRPQPRLDAEREDGMVVHIGRLRSCPVLSYKFVVLGHNTIRGAAGAALLNAELLAVRGLIN